MSASAGTVKTKTGAAALRIAAYLLSVTLVFAAISVLCNPENPVAHAAENGVIDLTSADFGESTVTIAETSFTMYPGAFYLPEDFKSYRVTQAGARYGTPGEALGNYGTLRLEMRLPPGEIYAIAGKSASYAQRLFINGKEYASVGVPADSIDTIVPKTLRYMEGFAVTDDTTEIIIHYTAFVYSDGGGLYPLELGLVRNVARAEQLRTFHIAVVCAILLAAMLFFFGLFLFFPQGRHLLWFALICGCIALRGLFITDKAIMLLLPNLDWFIAIRLELILTYCTALFTALYLDSLYPGTMNKWIIWGFTVLCLFDMLIICFTPPVVFSRFTGAAVWVCAGFVIFLLLLILIALLRKKAVSPLTGAEQILLLFGLMVYTSLSIVGIYAHQKSLLLFGLDYPNMGMSIFLFLNMLALALGFARTERELYEARRSEREMEETNTTLERLNRVKSNFLDNISHEMKTPLTIIGNYADTTIRQIRKNAVDAGTVKNLEIVRQEAQWLGRLVEQAKNDSVEKEWRLTFTDTEAMTILSKAAVSCEAVCRERGNRLSVQADKGLIPMRADPDGIYRVLFNLVINANKHTRDGSITVNTEVKENEVVFVVSDTGSGIVPELLPRVFTRGVSGDGSSGLGLAICREIVEQHGGKIDVQSDIGKGTAVRFTLPNGKEGDKE